MPDTQADGDKILHQDSVEEVIAEHLVDASTQAAIADLDPASATYVEAEANEVRDTLNDILGVLRDAGLIPAE